MLSTVITVTFLLVIGFFLGRAYQLHKETQRAKELITLLRDGRRRLDEWYIEGRDEPPTTVL